MDKKLVKYVNTTLHQGFSLDKIAEQLRKAGWSEKDIDAVLVESSKRYVKKARLRIALIGFITFIFLTVLVYFVVLSPTAAKPSMDRPIVGQLLIRTIPSISPEQKEQPAQISPMQTSDTDAIVYVLNELGVYKLHRNPFTNDLPEIVIFLTDTQQTFTAFVEYNKVHVTQGNSESPDARVKLTYDAILELTTMANEQEFQERAAQLLSERDKNGYTGEVLSSNIDLFLKGYLSLFKDNEWLIENGGITGSAVVDVSALDSSIVGMFVLLIVIWGVVLMRMAFGGRYIY